MSNTPQEHAVFSASSAHRWMRCAGAIAMEQGMPDRSSGFAEEGTAAHEVCARALQTGCDAQTYLGWFVSIKQGKVMSFGAAIETDNTEKVYEVTQDMVDHVQTYLDLVRGLCQIEGAMLFVEQRVQFGHVIDIEGQFGTSDATIVVPGEIIVVDFKYGMGVEVNAQENEQLMLYALGALEKYKFIHGVQKVRMIICQPRINHLSEWSCSVDDLEVFGLNAKEAARVANNVLILKATEWKGEVREGVLSAGEKQCRFCKAKAVCPALAARAFTSICDDFEDETVVRNVAETVEKGINQVKDMSAQRLATAMGVAPLVELWIKAVREAVYKSLMEGKPVEGFKLVRGKQGNRKWADEKAAQPWLYHALGAKSYKEPELISPTEADKLIKKAAKTPQWKATEKQLKQQELIPEDTTLRDIIMVDNVTRSPGSLSVAPESDERPAESPSSEIEAMFDNLGDE